MSESVLDKAYMGQLVAVQHNRGAEGGRVFARALDLDLNLASNQVRTQIQLSCSFVKISPLHNICRPNCPR